VPTSLTARSNARFLLTVYYHDDAGEPVDASTAVFQMQIRDRAGGASLYYTALPEHFTTVPADGLINLIIPKEIVETWTFVRGEYDILVNDDLLLEGPFFVEKGVTLDVLT
jgi:hypothetical protein